MKFCYNTNFTLPKQSQRSRSVLQDGYWSLGLFWKDKTLSYNRRNQYLFPVSMPFHKNQICMANYHTKSVCAANDHFPVSMPYRVAPCHPLQNSLTFPWHFTVFHILWQIKKKFFILYFNGVKCITSNLGLLLKERICSPREQILSFKSSPQCGWRWA